MTIVDRVKELIKVSGFQVAPAEIEALLVTHPGVADAAVVGVADERCGEVPKAFVVAAAGGRNSGAAGVSRGACGGVQADPGARGRRGDRRSGGGRRGRGVRRLRRHRVGAVCGVDARSARVLPVGLRPDVGPSGGSILAKKKDRRRFRLPRRPLGRWADHTFQKTKPVQAMATASGIQSGGEKKASQARKT